MKNQNYLIEVMSIVGFALIQIQRMEQSIRYCFILFGKECTHEGNPVWEYEEFDVIFEKNLKKVLGQFFKDISKTRLFKKEFEMKFFRFVKNRNRLIHSIFKEKQFSNLRNRRALERLHHFASIIIKDAMYFEKIFDAYAGLNYHYLTTRDDFEVKGINELKEIMKLKYERGDMDLLFQVLKTKKQSNEALKPIAGRGPASA